MCIIIGHIIRVQQKANFEYRIKSTVISVPYGTSTRSNEGREEKRSNMSVNLARRLHMHLERAQLRSMPLSELRSMAQRLRARALGDSRDEFAEYADTSIPTERWVDYIDGLKWIKVVNPGCQVDPFLKLTHLGPGDSRAHAR